MNRMTLATGSHDRAERSEDTANPRFAVVSLPAGPPPGKVGGNCDDSDDNSNPCQLVRVNLSAYQDNELDKDAKAAVDYHLSQCTWCSQLLAEITEADALIQEEWRSDSPLLFSSRFSAAIDSIMAELPADVPVETLYAPKRVHYRARWIRFAAGLTCLVIAVSALLTSYILGFNHARSLFDEPGHRSGAVFGQGE